MWFFRAGMSAVAVACAFLLFPATALARYPDDNGHHYGQLGNPGHHYGQLKHNQSPPPATVPPPGQPATRPQPLPGAPGAGNPARGATTVDQAVGAASGISEMPVTLPVGSVGATQIGFGNPPAGNNQDWLVLVLLPALIAVWLLLVARGALDATRRRRKRAA